MLRLSVLVALLVFSRLAPAAPGDASFTGAWVAWLCPSGVHYDPLRCSNLVIELHQRENRLCGAHVFATAGARDMDEGAAPSINGSISNGVATVTVESGRASPPLKISIEMKMTRGGLQWRRLETPDGDYLLPQSAFLSKSKHGSLLHPVFAQRLQAGCAAVLSAAAEGSAQARETRRDTVSEPR